MSPFIRSQKRGDKQNVKIQINTAMEVERLQLANENVVDFKFYITHKNNLRNIATSVDR